MVRAYLARLGGRQSQYLRTLPRVGRFTRGEFIQFLGHASGSLLEMRTQLEIAVDLNYLNEKEREGIEARAEQVSRMLNGLIDSMKTRQKSAGAH